MNHEVVYGFQSEEEARFPVIVQIALMHYICNSRCKRCPVGLYNRKEIGTDRKGEFDPERQRFFPFELFCKVADEMAGYPWSILRLHGRGEPLLHPDYVKMIEYAKKAGVKIVTSFTNATLLTKEKAKEILDAGLDVIELSIDAFSEHLYREFRGTDLFHEVVSNAENLISERNKRKAKTRVIVSAVDCPEIESEKEDFYRFWSERADKVIFRPYHTYGGRLPPLKPITSSEEKVPCAQLWTRFSINPYGQVNACFNDWADVEVIGDLNEEGATISQIWRNERFEAIREASLRGQSILKCCNTCLATKSGWLYSYQLLVQKLFAAEQNWRWVR
jgi:hypothetical protein